MPRLFPHPHPQAGFSLLEIAVVLVIVGLIVGGVLVGRDLIRASQLNAVVSEAARYTQAITDFRDKYHALPGDFGGATALWGAASGGCPGGARTGTQTCNGDGNGAIMTVDDCPPGTPPNCWWGTIYEPFQAWQHLADAGMIDGSYNTIPTSGGYPYAVPGTDIPASQLSGAGWFVVTITLGNCADLGSCESAGIPYLAGNIAPGIMLLLSGQMAPTTPAVIPTTVLTVSDAMSIDQKIDDGLPFTGKVVSSYYKAHPGGGSPSPCFIGGGAVTSANNHYAINQSGSVCALFFNTGL